MKNVLQKLKPRKHLARFYEIFDKRTYRSFCAIVESLLLFQNPVQADMAEQGKKSVSSIQYFFEGAKWCANRLNMARLSVLRNKKETRDRQSDMLVLDGSPVKKDKDTLSQFVSKIWDNRVKNTVNGYELFWAGIVTQEGYYYSLHTMIFIEKWYKSIFNWWIYFLKRCLKKTKAWLVIIDRWFKNQYFLQAILQANRQFLIRIDDTMLMLLEDIVQIKKDAPKKNQKKKWRKKKFPGRVSIKISKHIHKEKEKDEQKSKQKWILKIAMKDGTAFVIPHVIIKAWSDRISTKSTVIVYKRDKFKSPLVLCFSQWNVDKQKALELIQCYYKRWKIEQIFKEEKQLFVLENIKVRSIKALHRYIHIILLSHTMLLIKQLKIQSLQLLKSFIEFYLKKTRKIPRITLCSLKIFLEKCAFFDFDFKSYFRLFNKLFYASNP